MSAASKTLMEVIRPAKRIRSAPIEARTPKSSVSASSGGDAAVDSPAIALTVEQRRRMEFNKAIARSKRNLKLCADRIEKAKGTKLN
jgi:uracil-DNA glycosylase